MNRKVRDILFLLICVTLIFNTIPRPIQMGFLGGAIGNKLTFYPLAAAFLYSFWCERKYGHVFVNCKPFLRYVLAYLFVTLLSTAVGLYVYPYYDQVLSGPLDQIEKLPGVVVFLNAHGVAVDEKLLMQSWIIVRQLKSVVLEAFWCFGGAYLIYCWYREEWKRAVALLGMGVLLSSVCILAYSSIEIFYLAHAGGAESVLKAINPYIHTIEVDGKWWPPILWRGQLRSLFAEPSYYGIYMAFALPWLWNCFYEATGRKKAMFVAAVLFLLTVGLFLTKARTAFMLHAGELVILAGLVLLFDRNKKSFRRFMGVLSISAAAFLAGNLFISSYMYTGSAHSVEKTMSDYLESNAASLKNPDARSNRARYSVMMADTRIAMDHPVLGVGKGLRSSYLPDYFDKKALQNNEVRMWLDFRQRLGIMRSGIPALGEYTSRFAETGLLGLLVFFAPAGGC